MYKIKKDDIIKVISGKDKGKTGKVINVDRELSRVLVEGINYVKKHMRRTQDNQKGGIIQMERPVSLSNVMLFCKNCNRPAKAAIAIAKDKTKARLCKRCKQPF